MEFTVETMYLFEFWLTPLGRWGAACNPFALPEEAALYGE